jgi:hypothetical protein
MANSGRLNRVVILRIGANHTLEEISSEVASRGSDKPDLAVSLKNDDSLNAWFKRISLRDEDLEQIVDLCVSPGLDTNNSRLIYVNAVSDNVDSKINTGSNDLGYAPASKAKA